MSRFDYVKYDNTGILMQDHFKSQMLELERNIQGIGINSALRAVSTQSAAVSSLGRSKAMAVTKLEELYMWLGKAVRDDQILRNGSAELQEERKDG